MTGYLLDTNHVSAIYKDHQPFIARVQATAGAEFGISLPSMGELWFMVFNSARIRENSQRLTEMLRGDFRFWDFDSAAAVEFGRIKAELRQIGRPIPDIDTQTAAIARLNSLTVLSDDVHFTYVPGLAVDNWLR